MATGYTSIDSTKGKLQNDLDAYFKNTATDIDDGPTDDISDADTPISINTVSQLNRFLRNFPKPAATSATSNPDTDELFRYISKYTKKSVIKYTDTDIKTRFDAIVKDALTNNVKNTEDNSSITADCFKLIRREILRVDFTINNVLNGKLEYLSVSAVTLNNLICSIYVCLRHTKNKTPNQAINTSLQPIPQGDGRTAAGTGSSQTAIPVKPDDDVAYDKVIKAKYNSKPPKPEESTYPISIVTKNGKSTIQAYVTENSVHNPDGTYTVKNVDMTTFYLNKKNKSLQTFMKEYSKDLFIKIAENLSDWKKAFEPFEMLFTKKWEGNNNRGKSVKEFVQGVVFGRKMLRKGDYLYVFQHSDANLKLFMYIGNRINHSSDSFGFDLDRLKIDQEAKDIKKRIDDLLLDEDNLQKIAKEFSITKTDLKTKIKVITPEQYFLE